MRDDRGTSVEAVNEEVNLTAALLDRLTPSERQLYEWIREGKVDAEIAVRLSTSTDEVKARTQQILKKLALDTRADLAAAPTDPAVSAAKTHGADKRRLWPVFGYAAGMAVAAVLARDGSKRCSVGHLGQ